MSVNSLKRSARILLAALLLILATGGDAGAATNVGTAAELAAALANPASDDITLTKDIAMTPAAHDLHIDRSVKIIGGGNALDGVDQYRIFTLDPGANATFENVLFRKAKAAGNGGAVNILAGAATFNGGSFADNKADANKGGAVSVTSGATAKFNDTKFERNTAAEGGALHLAGAVTFTGAVAFATNTATGAGGAVYLDGATVSFPPSVSFTGNHAAKGGAVALSAAAKATLGGNTISANTAAEGGALHLPAGATLSFIASTTFQDNEASDKGGAIHASDLSLAPTGAVKLTFTGNKATGAAGEGGAVYVASRAKVGAGVEFLDNVSGGAGGAVYSAGKAEVSGGLFDNNRATTHGGAIHTAGAASVSGGLFDNNRADANGGAIHTAADADISGGTFKINKAGDSGGAIYAAGTATVSGGLFEPGNEAKGTAASSGGGAVRADKIFVRPSGASLAFDGQTTQGRGGALHATTALEAEKSVFRNNKAKENGGAVYALGTITLKASLFENNEALENSGGASFSEGASTIENCAFNRNIAKVGGGAAGVRGKLLLSDSSFIENSAEAGKHADRGGAVALQPGAGISSEVRRTLFKGNKARREGGAIYYESSDKNSLLAVESSVFSGNQVLEGDLGGGALFIQGSGKLDACTFANNILDTAPSSPNSGRGGAVAIDAKPDGKGTLTNCTFVGNEVNSFQGDGLGGAVYLDGESAMLHCTLTGENRAGTRDKNKNGLGGGVYLESGPLTITATAFVGNQASIGSDLFAQAGVKIFSGGYNRLGAYGNRSSGGPVSARWRTDPNVTGDTAGDQEALPALDLFGPNSLADNSEGAGMPPVVGSTIAGGATERLQTVALQTARPNPALDQIPVTKAKIALDERGVKRPQPYPTGNLDVGAFESPSGSLPPTPGTPVVGGIKMSEIPNTMTQIGQTTSLVAVVTDQGGKPVGTAESVAWKSSNPRVARIDQYGNLVSLSMGKTVISVSTVIHTANGGPAVDSADLTVSEEMSYTNVHPDVWRQLGLFNDTLAASASSLHFVAADPKKVEAASFQDPFKAVWSTSPTQVTKLENPGAVSFASTSGYSGNKWSAAKPSINVAVGGQKNGALLPLKYVWSLSWNDVSKLLGRKVTNVQPSELFKALKIVFQAADGTTYPVVDADGEYGVAADQAVKSAMKLTNGNNGLTVTLTVYVGDLLAPAAASAGANRALSTAGPKLLDGILVLPDGLADSTLSGSMWLLQNPLGGGTNPTPGGGSGGGGGGCNAGFSALLLLGAAAFVLRHGRA